MVLSREILSSVQPAVSLMTHLRLISDSVSYKAQAKCHVNGSEPRTMLEWISWRISRP